MAKTKARAKAKANTRARARAAARGIPGVKKLKKKSFLVVVAPGTNTFPAATQVTTVVGQDSTGTMPFEITKQELDPSTNSKRILLSIKGTKTRLKSRRTKVRLDPPDPGDLTITLTGQGPNIDPVVTVPVVFVDDFDP